jgi:hypothetical protein
MSINHQKEFLLNKYGPLVGGEELICILGFKTKAAFYRSLRMNKLGVEVFNIEGRKGKFALTENVADWLSSFNKKTKGD